jgi:hypothetical protein
VQGRVSPAPWLVDGGRVTVRPLFPAGDDDALSGESDSSDGSDERSGVSAPPGKLAPAAPSPPPPVVEPPPPVRDPHSEAFVRAVAEHATARARALIGVEEQLLELAVQLAEVLVERELISDPALHAVLVRAALAALEGDQPAVVRASRPAYAALVASFGEGHVEVDGTQVPVTLDPRLEGVGVVVDGADTRVDGRVGERLRSALRAMQEERRRREAEVAT